LDAQIFYLGFSLFILAIIFTSAACHHPKGAQLATYGHLKTLLELDNRQEAHGLVDLVIDDPGKNK
jgi:hypothetical protein